jgi:hypothetical protein
VADAREKMKIAAGALTKDGVDPAATKIQDRASKTIGDLAHEYLTQPSAHADIQGLASRANLNRGVQLAILAAVEGGRVKSEALIRHTSHHLGKLRLSGPAVRRANRLAARNAALSEEIRERGVIEEVLRLDDLCLPETGDLGDIPGIELRVDWSLVGWRRLMALPA